MLIANSSKPAAVLGLYNYCTVRAAYDYRNHMSIAFQILDDVINFDVDGEYSVGDNINSRVVAQGRRRGGVR